MSRSTTTLTILSLLPVGIICFRGIALAQSADNAADQVVADAPSRVSQNPHDRFFCALGPKLPATVDGFTYELTIKPHEKWTPFDELQVAGIRLQILGQATSPVDADGKVTVVLMKTRLAPGLIDLVADRTSDTVTRGDLPVKVPPRYFHVEISSLVVLPDRPALLRICFRDQTHVYALDYEDGKGLTISAADMHERKFGACEFPEFKQVQIEDGKRLIVCSPLGIAATQDGRPLWQRDIVMHGQPEKIRLVGQTILVTTDKGHSFYARRDTGEMIFYHNSLLRGEGPLAEILQLGRDVMAGRGDGKYPVLGRFIRAAAMLEDRAAAPFLIDAVAKGFGQPEKCLAVAALEKLNGNPDLFNLKGARPGDTILHVVGSKRVYPDAINQAERAKWRKVFGVE